MRMKRTLAIGIAAMVGMSTPALAGPADELRDAGRRALEAGDRVAHHPQALLVRFKPGAAAQDRRRALGLVNGQSVRAYALVPGLEQIRTGMDPQQAAAILSQVPSIEYAEVDHVVHAVRTPNDEFFSLQWGIHNVGQDIRGTVGVADADIDGVEAWDIATGDATFVVAVIDTGTQWSHPDLDANIWTNPGEIAGNGVDDDGNGYVDDVRGWDFYSNDNNPDDGDGHGTHTAGTIGAEGNNGIGVAGVNWHCRIMPLRFLGPFGGYTSDAIDALDYAVANGAKVSNNSWGGGGFSNALFDAIDAARQADHLFVAAAGNNGVDTDGTPHYPSSYGLDNIISVAAIDNRDRLADFSNYGASSVDLGAPGVDIASTYSGSRYVWSSGTSMAAPHVAGVAALLWSQNPSWNHEQVRDRIFATVRPTPALDRNTVTGGVLNAAAALGGGGDPTNQPPTVLISSPADGSAFQQGAEVTFTATATDPEDGDLTASIVWTSNLMGVIGAGGSFSRSDLTAGDHTIVASVSDSGSRSDDDVVTISIEAPGATPPAAPDAVAAQDNADGTATVTWSDRSDDETGFEIQREKQHRNGRWISTTTAGAVDADTTTFTDASGSGTFRYRVRAFNDAGASDWSAWAEVAVTGGGGGGGGGGNGGGKGNNKDR